jgi:hypothetical protein
MAAATRASVFDLDAPAARHGSGRKPLGQFLALTLLLPAIIVIGNFALGVLTPITGGPEDDMSMLDSVWRLVQGQRLGIDFHDPLGFGFFQVAAMLWRLLGPHHYVLRAADELFAFVIVICGCVVSIRQLRDAAALAALFCVTVAVVASAPSIYGFNQYFSMTLSYDRLIMASLAVLFVQSFSRDSNAAAEHRYIDHFTAAFLLNTLLVVKISGLVVGIAIVVVGAILRGPSWRRVVDVVPVLLFLAVFAAIDLFLTGTSLHAVIHDYRMAAQGRVGSVSPSEVLWFARRWPVLAVIVLLGLYVISRPESDDKTNLLLRGFCIIAFYWLCQVVLNMSNGSQPDLTFLAPAAVIAIVTWTDPCSTASFWNGLWRKFDPRRLSEISARQIIPLVIIVAVFLPEAVASLRAVKLDYSIWTGITKSITVSADKGIDYEMPEDSRPGTFAYLDDAIRAIERLDASQERIANLDYMNPFPVLFLAPAPKGIWVWWNFSRNTNVPVGYRPSWQEVIGDACIVTEPKNSPEKPTEYYSAPLIEAVRPHLATAFTLVHEDEMWKIWRHNGGCPAM